MDVRLNEGEKLNVTVVNPITGENFIVHLSTQSIMSMGYRMVDGVSFDEINVLRRGSKILAIKGLRLRTGVSLTDAKRAIEDYVEKHECCRQFPYCEHANPPELQGISLGQLQFVKEGMSCVRYTYPAILTEEQARLLTRKFRHFRATSIFSFYIEQDALHTTWCCTEETEIEISVPPR